MENEDGDKMDGGNIWDKLLRVKNTADDKQEINDNQVKLGHIDVMAMFRELIDTIKELNQYNNPVLRTMSITVSAGTRGKVDFTGSKVRWYVMQNGSNNVLYFSQGDNVVGNEHFIPADSLFHFFPASKVPILSFYNPSGNSVTVVVTASTISPNL